MRHRFYNSQLPNGLSTRYSAYHSLGHKARPLNGEFKSVFAFEPIPRVELGKNRSANPLSPEIRLGVFGLRPVLTLSRFFGGQIGQGFTICKTGHLRFHDLHKGAN